MSRSEDCLARVTRSRLWLNLIIQISRVWRLLGRVTLFQALVKCHGQMSRSEDCLAGSLCSRLWVNKLSKCQGLKTAWQGHMFQALVKCTRQMSRSEDCLAGSPLSRLWLNQAVQMSRSEDCLAGSHPSRLWSNIAAKCQGLKTAWQGHFVPGSG